MIGCLKHKVYEVAGKRCDNCPAFWTSCDHWGEWDAGCSLGRDVTEFCALSLLPRPVMTLWVKWEDWRNKRYFERWAEKEADEWDEWVEEQNAQLDAMPFADEEERL